MKHVLYALSVLLALSVAACGKTDSPEPEAEDALHAMQPAPAPSPPAETRIVRTKVAPGQGTAIAMTATQSVVGSLEAESDGQLVAFGVRIGNYRDSADGSLSLELCVEGACQDVAMPLDGSRDNDYLVYRLPEPVVLGSGQRIEYTLGRSGDATNRVAVWAYPAREDQAGLIDATGRPTDLVPRLELHYRR